MRPVRLLEVEAQLVSSVLGKHVDEVVAQPEVAVRIDTAASYADPELLPTAVERLWSETNAVLLDHDGV